MLIRYDIRALLLLTLLWKFPSLNRVTILVNLFRLMVAYLPVDLGRVQSILSTMLETFWIVELMRLYERGGARRSLHALTQFILIQTRQLVLYIHPIDRVQSRIVVIVILLIRR